MVMRGRCSSSAKDIRGEVQRRLPGCREFVSKFWGVGKELAQPRMITVEESSGTGHSACIIPDERKVVLFADKIDIGDLERLKRVLVHELSHLVTISFMDMSKDESRCAAEGLASLATDAYFSEDMEYSVEKLPYFRGKRFIRALFDGGVEPAQMHPMLSTVPTITELFIPSRYLDRMGMPYSFDYGPQAHGIQEWVELATCIGRLSFGEGISYSKERGGFVFGFSPGEKIGNLKERKGMPRNLLHNPGAYGIRFMEMLSQYLKGMEQVFDILKRFPPVEMVGRPESIAHMIEPHRYVIRAQMLGKLSIPKRSNLAGPIKE